MRSFSRNYSCGKSYQYNYNLNIGEVYFFYSLRQLKQVRSPSDDRTYQKEQKLFSKYQRGILISCKNFA